MLNTIVILGDSHVNIYNHSQSLKKYFKNIKIHHTDCEDVSRNGKFTPYLTSSLQKCFQFFS